MGEAGSKNLAAWRAAQGKEQGQERLDLAAETARFDTLLRADLGHDPNSAEVALLLVAASSYAAVFIAFNKLVGKRRIRRPESTLDRLVRAQGHLLRAVRALRTGSIKPEASWEQELAEITAEIAESKEANDAQTASS